jgi:hypothetical protein
MNACSQKKHTAGYAFVYFQDERDAEDAIRRLSNAEFGHTSRRLSVEWSRVTCSLCLSLSLSLSVKGNLNSFIPPARGAGAQGPRQAYRGRCKAHQDALRYQL